MDDHIKHFVCVFLLSLCGVVQPLPAASGKHDERQDLFVFANVQFTLCHELTHALISTFDIPVLGSEEDGADQISAICFLHPTDKRQRDPRAIDKLLAVADAWRLEWELDKNSGGSAYWDEHALDIQRYYNILCLLYGSDPLSLEDLPDKLELPWQRAWSCADYEYDRAVKAGEWLLETYGVRDNQSADRTTGKVKVIYDDPGEHKQRAYRMLTASAHFERKADLMNSIFELPHDIYIVVTDCLGDTTAYWNHDLRTIVFCYDLVQRFVLLAELRQCILGHQVGLENRRPMDPMRIKKCLIDVQ